MIILKQETKSDNRGTQPIAGKKMEQQFKGQGCMIGEGWDSNKVIHYNYFLPFAYFHIHSGVSE